VSAARQPRSTAQATKGDIHKLTAGIQAVGADLRRVESKLTADIQTVMSKLTADIQTVRVELGTDIRNVASKVVEMGETLVILETIESSIRFVAQGMTGKASATAMNEADERLAGRVSLLEDATRQHAVDIRQLRSRAERR
jgi:hypothetical protein